MATNDNTTPQYLTLEDVNQLLDNFKTSIMTEVNTANQGLAANLTKRLQTASSSAGNPRQPAGEASSEDEDTSPGRLSLKALQTQLTTLTNELATEKRARTDAEKQRTQAELTAHLSSLVSERKLEQPTAVQTLFMSRYGQAIKQEGSNWLVEQGEDVKPLNSVLDEYLTTDEGKFYLPKPKTPQQSSTNVAKNATAPSTTTGVNTTIKL